MMAPPDGTSRSTSLSAVRAAAAALAPWGRRFVDHGGWRLYVVGGAVRSLLVGCSLGDADEVDMTTDAPPARIKEILGGWADTIWTQGERFGTVGCRRAGRIVEITTHRAEVYSEGSRRPDVTYGDDLLADLARRDFTIGAMAFELPVSVAGAAGIDLIDPFGGWDDLQHLRLRTPRSPEQSFSEDPLRMLRAGRFVATLGLVAEEELEAAMESLRSRLDIVSVERCGRELSLLLAAEAPAAGAALLARTGVLAQIVPELGAASALSPAGHRAPGCGTAGGGAAAGGAAVAGGRCGGDGAAAALSRSGRPPLGCHCHRSASAARRRRIRCCHRRRCPPLGCGRIRGNGRRRRPGSRRCGR